MIDVNRKYEVKCTICNIDCKQYYADIYFNSHNKPITDLIAECKKCKSKVVIQTKSIVSIPITDDKIKIVKHE